MRPGLGHQALWRLAALAVDVLPMLEDEARERLATSTGGANPRPKEKIPYPEKEKGQARDHAAALFTTNGRYVSDAKESSHNEQRNPLRAPASPAAGNRSRFSQWPAAHHPLVPRCFSVKVF